MFYTKQSVKFLAFFYLLSACLIGCTAAQAPADDSDPLFRPNVASSQTQTPTLSPPQDEVTIAIPIYSGPLDLTPPPYPTPHPYPPPTPSPEIWYEYPIAINPYPNNNISTPEPTRRSGMSDETYATMVAWLATADPDMATLLAQPTSTRTPPVTGIIEIGEPGASMVPLWMTSLLARNVWQDYIGENFVSVYAGEYFVGYKYQRPSSEARTYHGGVYVSVYPPNSRGMPDFDRVAYVVTDLPVGALTIVDVSYDSYRLTLESAGTEQIPAQTLYFDIRSMRFIDSLDLPPLPPPTPTSAPYPYQ